MNIAAADVKSWESRPFLSIVVIMGAERIGASENRRANDELKSNSPSVIQPPPPSPPSLGYKLGIAPAGKPTEPNRESQIGLGRRQIFGGTEPLFGADPPRLNLAQSALEFVTNPAVSGVATH